MALDKEPESLGGTISAAFPTTSGREPAFVQITGVAAAMLSSVVYPKPSYRDGSTVILARLYSVGRCFWDTNPYLCFKNLYFCQQSAFLVQKSAFYTKSLFCKSKNQHY